MSQTRNNLLKWDKQFSLSNDQTEIISKTKAKEPSMLGLFLSIFVTLSLYTLGFYQLSKAVNNLVDTVEEKVDPDYRFN